MIDVHCHILPGIDDGAPDLATSVEMGRVAAADGVRTVVATPHIREDHPFDRASIPALVAEVNAALEAAGVDLEVLPGGELAVSEVLELGDDELGALSLGGAGWLLVESPYTHAADMLENNLFDLQLRGFGVILAHPERSPSLMSDPDRLARMVERGILCSVTAGSMEGRFGRTVRRATVEMLKRGLAHDVASDAHDPDGRPPELRRGFDALSGELAWLTAEQRDWMTRAVPEALLAGAAPPPAPGRPGGGRLRRMLGR